MVARWLVPAIVAIASTVASAQPKAPESEAPDTTRAKVHYKQGKAFLASGLYDDAIREFQAAYQIAPVPDLLFNIAQAHRLKGDAAKALAMYQKYLEESPDGAGADEAHTHIANLTKVIREHKDQPPPPRPTWHDDDDDPKPTPAPPAPQQLPPVPPTAIQDPDDTGEDRAHRRAIGQYLIYGGAALEVVAGAFLYFGADLDNQIRAKSFTTADELRSAASLGTVYNWTAGLSLGLGAAGIATGITMILRNHDAGDVRVGAAASRDFTGLVVSGRL